MLLTTAVAALAIAAVHAFGGRVKGVDAVPRSWLLSTGSGVAAAYVFVHLLPELAEIQEHLEDAELSGVLGATERHAFLIALLGLAVFYGIELAARRSRGPDTAPREGRASRELGWVQISSYAVYNAIVGALLHTRAETGAVALTVYAVAMGLHFLVNDHGLREHHPDLYHGAGRWIVATAVLVGWAVGASVEVAEAVLGVFIAFLGGGIIMNVMKEELPEDREAHWLPFVVGATAYSALLLVA